MQKASLVEQLVHLVFPIDCLGCGQEGTWLCDGCCKQVFSYDPHRCQLCGKAGTLGICGNCRSKTKLDGLICLADYHEPVVKQLIQTIKYHNQPDASANLIQRYRRTVSRFLPGDDFVISFVPSDPARRRVRGYNQAELIAQQFAGMDYELRSLFMKEESTPSQTTFNKSSRQRSLRKVFRPLKKTLPTQLVIIDDVVTTGATLSGLAKVAKKHGCQTVIGVSLAHD